MGALARGWAGWKACDVFRTTLQEGRTSIPSYKGGGRVPEEKRGIGPDGNLRP